MGLSRNDILKKANEVVQQMLDDGWLIDFGDSASGYDFKVDMTAPGAPVMRVGVYRKLASVGDWRQLDSLVLTIETLGDTGFVDKSVKPVVLATYYEIARDWVRDEVKGRQEIGWYSEDAQEAVRCKELGLKRRRTRNSVPILKSIPASDSLLECLRKRNGFENATEKNIVCERIMSQRNLYSIQIKNRVGRVTSELSFYMEQGRVKAKAG